VLPKTYRLTKKKDFDQLIKKGKSIGQDFLVLKFLKTNLKDTRIGFIVSRKVSNKAVVRNRIKRKLREAVRAFLFELKPGYDLVFFAKKEIKDNNFLEIKKAIEGLFQKARLLTFYLKG